MAEAMEPTLISDTAKPQRSAILAPEELAPFFPAYEIMRLLGRGGMGAVYLARQISLNRLVAIKLLPANLSEGEINFAERFKNEAQAMAQLNHPGIVAVYDFGQTANGLLFIVMEYIEGTDVQLMLASQGRLHSAHAMAITAHVCDALQYAHMRGIIHRDIKPSNIMVSSDGVVKVADFGLAKMSHGQTTVLTQSGMAMGTLHFMAPEALTLGTAVDQRADIYAVGVMLYQMLTGRLPQGMFEMPSFQVPGLDPRYDRIVARALRDDREQRYQAAFELRHDLDAILTQPVEQVVPEAVEEVKALPPVDQRGKKKARVPSLPPLRAALPESAGKKRSGIVLSALCLIAAFVYYSGYDPSPTAIQPELATKDKSFRFGDSRYLLVNEKLTWDEAKAKAETLGGHLAVITSKAEDDRVKQSVTEGDSRREIWVGGLSKRVKGPWEWVTEEPFEYSAWGGNEPDGSGKNNRFGIALLSNASDPLKVRWTDAGVEQRHEFLVEWNDSVRSGATPVLATKEQPFINTLGMKFVPVPETKVLFSIWDTRVRDYAVYAEEQEASGKTVDASWRTQSRHGVPAGREPDHPVVAVGWDEAQAFCQWLTKKEGAEGGLPEGAWYRLPSDEEWSWAVGLPPEQGATPADKSEKNSLDYPWGKEWPPSRKVGNYADEMFHAKFPKDFQHKERDQPWIVGYEDGYATTSPVGCFPANAHGLYDMGGNVFQWCEDWFDKDQKYRVWRGGSFGNSGQRGLLSSCRDRKVPSHRGDSNGFRCVLAFSEDGRLSPVKASVPAAASVAPTLQASASAIVPVTATKETPFVNTLGMKFVPVPITGGPTDRKRVLFSVWETRVQDYEMFVKETHPGWLKPEYAQDPAHPVINVSWDDAQTFCAWLTKREHEEGKLGAQDSYRLPSDHEWSCAVGIGELEDAFIRPVEKSGNLAGVFPWGRAWPPPVGFGNYAGEDLQPVLNVGKPPLTKNGTLIAG